MKKATLINWYRRFKFYQRRFNNRYYDNLLPVKLVVTFLLFLLIAASFFTLAYFTHLITMQGTISYLLFCTVCYLMLLHFTFKQHRQCCYCFNHYTGYCACCNARVCDNETCTSVELADMTLQTEMYFCIECFEDMQAAIATK